MNHCVQNGHAHFVDIDDVKKKSRYLKNSKKLLQKKETENALPFWDTNIYVLAFHQQFSLFTFYSSVSEVQYSLVFSY